MSLRQSVIGDNALNVCQLFRTASFPLLKIKYAEHSIERDIVKETFNRFDAAFTSEFIIKRQPSTSDYSNFCLGRLMLS